MSPEAATTARGLRAAWRGVLTPPTRTPFPAGDSACTLDGPAVQPLRQLGLLTAPARRDPPPPSPLSAPEKPRGHHSVGRRVRPPAVAGTAQTDRARCRSKPPTHASQFDGHPPPRRAHYVKNRRAWMADLESTGTPRAPFAMAGSPFQIVRVATFRSGGSPPEGYPQIGAASREPGRSPPQDWWHRSRGGPPGYRDSGPPGSRR